VTSVRDFLNRSAGRVSRQRRRPVAGLLLLLLGLVLTGSLYATLAPSSSADSAANDEELIAEGRQLFLVGCSFCHGQNGEGQLTQDGNQLGPSLAGVGAAAVDFQVGTGRMPAATSQGPQVVKKKNIYSQAEIDQLAAYIASLGSGPSVPTEAEYGPEGADIAKGGDLFRTNCAQCHNFVGAGGELTSGKFAPSLAEATPTQIYEAMVTGPANMPVFGDKTITPDQKLAIVNYVKSIRAQADPGGAGLGRIGPVSETLAGILVGLGGCVLAALWIGTRA